jgi:hypothetical protein
VQACYPTLRGVGLAGRGEWFRFALSLSGDAISISGSLRANRKLRPVNSLFYFFLKIFNSVKSFTPWRSVMKHEDKETPATPNFIHQRLFVCTMKKKITRHCLIFISYRSRYLQQYSSRVPL